ncbi:cobyrinate a,c-diamide synthase [Bacillus sp. FJAT-47783]|uniref:cobyrinate a,c-diamide synthase n=1 Tax=Bacillus sp. FJAT-47783 TaxID=2922712 RepID=UPI001FAB601E
MRLRRIVIAGTGSGVGKTTISIGLMAALSKIGYTVQGFKCGPDYIDPSYHTAVTKRPSRNLDSWMLKKEVVKEVFINGSKGADISIIEGVMGFYDGKDPLSNVGSTAEISILTESPVLLVVNCASMARSAAAIVKGFQALCNEVNIVGVIANRVGSQGHYKLVKAAIEQECQIPVVGYVKRDAELSIPERHLGLIPSIERGELDSFFHQLGETISQTVNIKKIYDLANVSPIEINDQPLFVQKDHQNVRIAVAKDSAFNFYYRENFELLQKRGAELVFFSPLKGEKIPPNVHGLYIGGGFPEEFAEQLAHNENVKASIKEAVESGMPTLAECGGFMYLTESIETTVGKKYEMIGFIKGHVKMQKKLAALGYREIRGEKGNYLFGNELTAKGHEFHYSTFESGETVPAAYWTKGLRQEKLEGIQKENVIAGYTHLHFASCPELVQNWIEKCKQYKKGCVMIHE